MGTATPSQRANRRGVGLPPEGLLVPHSCVVPPQRSRPAAARPGGPGQGVCLSTPLCSLSPGESTPRYINAAPGAVEVVQRNVCMRNCMCVCVCVHECVKVSGCMCFVCA